MKSILKKIIPPNIWKKISIYKQSVRARLVGYNPKRCMSMFYRDVFKSEMNWDNPVNLIEKINWLQLNTDTSKWSLCADKYNVRKYVAEKGCDKYLVNLIGVWENANDIDWDSLPEQFVLKTTQGCGEVLLIRDKTKLNIKKTIKQLNNWLKEKYGLINGQTHYTRIKPRIIAEQLLLNSDNLNESVVDYKIWCFHGKPEFILVVYDRVINGQYHLSAYDLNWNDISSLVFNSKSKHIGGKSIKRPENLEEMLSVASKLSEDFPEARVDLYNINNKIYFGELTFTTGFGYFNEEYYRYLGSLIKLPEAN